MLVSCSEALVYFSDQWDCGLVARLIQARLHARLHTI